METLTEDAVAANAEQPENGCMTFKETAEKWLKDAVKRSRKPIRATSVPTIKSGLKLYIYPHIGSLPLEKVNNKTVKACVDAMKEAKLSSSSMQSYVGFVKRIVNSVVDEESGEPKYLRRWSATYLDLPEVEHTKTPSLTKEQIETMLEFCRDDNEHVLYMLLAATGLRIGEALGLEWRHVINDGRTLVIEQKVNRYGKIEKGLKTKAGKREVDLNSLLGNMFLCWSKKETGLMFPSRNAETPWRPNNLEKRRLRNYFSGGWHAFRRFRETHLSAMSCNHDLQLFWLGHKPQTMSEVYSKISRDLDFRLREADRVGMGFDYIPMTEEPLIIKLRRPRKRTKTIAVTQSARMSS